MPLNRSAILTAAWTEYRLIRQLIFALRKAWADAKRAAAHQTAVDTARAFVAAQARVMSEKVAAMPAGGDRSLRISQLKDEITVLDYAPWGVRTGNRRTQLDAELSAFTA